MVHVHSLPDRVKSRFIRHAYRCRGRCVVYYFDSFNGYRRRVGYSVQVFYCFSSRFDARNSMVRRDSGVANVKASAYL